MYMSKNDNRIKSITERWEEDEDPFEIISLGESNGNENQHD